MLEKIVGARAMEQGAEERYCHSYDATGRSYLPDVVVFPSTTSQVSRIFKFACEQKISVIPRGNGSGMTGGSLPLEGGIVLSMGRMNAIHDIDEENFTASVEPGVITGDFHRAVEKKGLFYPPDPASSSFCTLGGNIAECAGGPRAVKYGVTRNYVLGLEAVLPTGEIIHTGVQTAKGVAGYDLTRLIVGSEGTLAVVTRMTLRLIPLPEKIETLSACFSDIHQAASTVSAIIRTGIVPRCVEFLDRSSLELVKDSLGASALAPGTCALLILEVDGKKEMVATETRQLKSLCLSMGAIKVTTARNSGEAATIWKARKALSPLLYQLAPHKINEDIVVPISAIPDMVGFIEQLQRQWGLTIVSFGHAGDGNIHCNIMYDKRDEDQCRRAQKAVDALFEHTLKLGGTITGEHGVGITKKKYLTKEIGPVEIGLMRQIKHLFDPHNILNPGKIF
ncbi:FAD-binding oxidoreductase [Desulfocicer vacuolatum]|uniref:FAD-binding oxidoreductase n=1 Tax=Desulfocicer vacuolatum TaxID=2298 RepID=UPI002FC375E7